MCIVNKIFITVLIYLPTVVCISEEDNMGATSVESMASFKTINLFAKDRTAFADQFHLDSNVTQIVNLYNAPFSCIQSMMVTYEDSQTFGF